MEHMTVLCIEHNPSDARMVRDGLADTQVHEAFGLTFTVRWVQTLADGLEELLRGGVDVILLDPQLPGSHELEALTEVRSAAPTQPIVILVAIQDSVLAVRALQMGAQGYYVKGPVDGRLLAHTLVTTLREPSERSRVAEQFHPHEERMRQAQKMETLGRLAGGVTHELNNLFTSIIGYSDLLLMSLEPESPQFRYTQQIADVSNRASGLTRQLLAFSRQQSNAFQPLTWNVVVQETLQMIHPLLGKEIDLRAEVATNLGRLEIDPGLLQQVLVNVLVNARDAMPEGGTLHVELASIMLPPSHGARYLHAPPGRYVRLTIRDSGVGMVPGVLEHLFEPYFTTKAVGKGTGLGLSIVYDIVKENCGDIEIQSQVGEGTTVHMYFPQASQVEPASVAC